MEHFSIDMQIYPRLFSDAFPVRGAMYLPRQNRQARYVSPRNHFSFILKGAGRYATAGRSWRIEAPCVFTQWTGVFTEYGPAPVWDELAFSYDDRWTATLKKSGLISPRRPCWAIDNPVRFLQLVPPFFKAIAECQTLGGADRIDSLALQLIKESLIGHLSEAPRDRYETVIRAIQSELAARVMEQPDVLHVARNHGLSPPNFRKQWQRFCAYPPVRYLMQLWMQEARRLLLETTLSIKEIAARLGFEDALYFSRRFRQITGYSASDYREQRIVQP